MYLRFTAGSYKKNGGVPNIEEDRSKGSNFKSNTREVRGRRTTLQDSESVRGGDGPKRRELRRSDESAWCKAKRKTTPTTWFNRKIRKAPGESRGVSRSS